LHAATLPLIGALAADPEAGPRALAALLNLLARPALQVYLATLVTRPTLDHLPAFIGAVADWSAKAGVPLPVILTALLPQSRALANHAAMLPAPLDAGQAVSAALARARELDVPVVHRNLPPCLVPGWEAWSADGFTRNARIRVGSGELLPGQRDDAWHQRRECSRCRWAAICPGVHAGTVAIFGWEDHRPVPPPRSAALEPSPPALAWFERSPGRAVVVGGSGLLGRHVVRRLLGAGWQVTSVSRRGEPERPGLTVVRADRSEPGLVENLLAAAPDLWIDLALFDAREARALIDAWRPDLPTRLVAAGSVAEYGALHLLPCPVPELTPPDPADAYGRGKAEAWAVLRQAFEQRGVPVTWAVLPQLWGPGDRQYRDGAWIHALVHGRPLVLRGDGRARVPDGHAGTAADGLLHLAGDPSAIGLRAQVAGPEQVSALDFLGLAAGVLRRDATVLLVPARTHRAAWQHAGRPLRSVFPDRDVLLEGAHLRAGGFEPSLSAADGVRVTALAHAHRAAPPGDSPFDVPAEVAARLREQPDVRVLRLP
jgi:nucleoside-diphosphate-sugar epimerase